MAFSIKSAIKKGVSAVGSSVKNAVSSVKSALTGTKASASAGMAFPVLPGVSLSSRGVNQSVAPNMTVAPNAKTGDPGGPGYSYNGGAISINSPIARTISSQAGTAANLQSPIYSSRSISSGQIPESSVNRIMASSEGISSLSAPSIGSVSSLSSSAPSAPSYQDVGLVNNGGLNIEGKNVDPSTGLFVDTPQDEGSAEEKKRLAIEERLQAMIPGKDSVSASPEIMAQNEVIRQKQAEVNNYTSQLNNVVAQQQADLLRLRGIGGQEGVTETVYGGQQAQINREAAIKALPIQAALAGAQGNLELAQDYLTQLTTWKTEEINNEYNYKTALYGSIRDFVKGEQKIKLDALEKKASQKNALEMNNLNFAQSIATEAFKNGNVSAANKLMTLMQNPSSPSFMNDVGSIAGTVSPATTGNVDIEEQISQLKLSAAQKSDLVDISTLNAQISSLESLMGDGLEGVGGFGVGSAKQFVYKQFGKGSQEGAEVRTTIGNIKGQIAKLRGGTSFTANEEKLLDSYVPGINESQASIASKLNGLKSFLTSKQNAIIRIGGGVVPTNQEVSTPESLRTKYNY